ncbi:MAG: glycine betaine/L-proline ABC transporter ATP-binding protein [Bacillota bacterium]
MNQIHTDDKAISIKNLCKIFGPRKKKSLQLLDEGKDKDEIQEITGDTIGVADATFDIYPQETFIVMGLSGSGKSTLVRCVIRLIEPTRGSIKIKGKEITTMDSASLRETRRRELGMVFQHFGLFPHRTVIDNVGYGLEIQGETRDDRYKRAQEVLDLVGLSAWGDHKPKELSGGMQQRVGLARALANDPNILLMDEPFSALDPLIRREMQKELVEMQRKLHKSILFITHDLDEALKLGDRIAIMNQGRIVQIGTPKEIVTEPADDYVASFVRDVDRLKILSAVDAVGPDIPVLPSETSLNRAWDILSESSIPYCVVTGSRGNLIGTVYAHQVLDALGDKRTTLADLPTREAEVASPTSPAEELLPKMSANYHPIVLINDDHGVEGVVDASSLIASLVEDSTAPAAN